MRITHFFLFMCLYLSVRMYFQVKLGGEGADSLFGQKPLVKNTPPVPLNVSWGGGEAILHNIQFWSSAL